MPETQLVPNAKILFQEGFLEDPYPIYRRLQDEGEIHYVNYSSGMWAIFRHAECSAVIRDPRLSARRTATLLRPLPPERQGDFGELTRMLGMWMLFLDAPEHTRLRKLMNKGFSPQVVDSLRPQVEAIVDRMLEPLRHAFEADLMREIVHPLPVRVIAEMLGIPDKLHAQVISWSDAIAVFMGNPLRSVPQTEAAQEAVLELTAFFRQAVAERREHRGSDLISLLLTIEEDGEILTEEELYAQCVMLLFGGHETTRNLIGNGIWTLLHHSEDTAELRDRPEIIRTAVEELLRYESPVQYTGRTAKDDMEVCGVPVPKGKSVIFMLGAANRDPRQFKDPDRLNLKRANNPHLAFGAGAHFCIGNQLARLEGQVAILKMIQEFPKMRPAAQAPDWVPNFGFRGLKTLPVSL
ncbi:MAG TPA: cytochrome P450 [Candidatus Methylomirabilis sp.]|nr:cytochrome P450 [Candidatus Methylomirabilis sp.]